MSKKWKKWLFRAGMIVLWLTLIVAGALVLTYIHAPRGCAALMGVAIGYFMGDLARKIEKRRGWYRR